MATNNRTADVLLRYKVDNSSVNSVRASFDAVQSRIDNLQADLAGVGTSAQRGVSGLRTQFRTASTDVGRVQGDVESLRAELQRLDDVVVSPEVRVNRTGGGDGAAAFDSVDRAGSVGSQILSGLGAGDAANAAGLLGDVAGAFTALNPVMLATTAVGAGVALVFGDIQRRMQEARDAAQQYLVRQTEINLLLLQGNTDDLEARRTQLQQEISARVRTADSIQSLVTQYDELQRGADAILSGQEELNTTGLNYAEILQAQEQIQQQLRDTMQNQTVTVGTARDQLVEWNAETEKIKANLSLVEIALSGVVNKVVEFGDKGALAIDKILKEVDKLGGSFGTGSIAGKFSAYQAQQATLSADLAALQTDRAGAYLNSITQTVTAQEALRKAQDAYNETITASQARITEINAKLQADLSEAEAERQRDLAEAAADAGEQRVRAEEQKQAEIARIQKRFDRSYANAVAERDALGATRAEQQRDDELEQLDERYKDQLKAVDTGLKAQQKLINDRYSQQVQTVRAGAEAALRLEQQRAQQEINLRQQAVQAATVQLVNALNNETIIRNTFYQQSISQAQSWASLMQLYIAYGLQAPGGVSVVGTSTPYFTGNSATNPYIGYQGGRAEGGPMYPGGVYKVGERGAEYVTPLYPSMVHPAGSGIGGMTINVVGAQTGTIRAESRAQALAAFDRVLRGMGVA